MIAAEFCPTESEGVCHTCNRWSAYCRTIWNGVVRTSQCRRCRTADTVKP